MFVIPDIASVGDTSFLPSFPSAENVFYTSDSGSPKGERGAVRTDASVSTADEFGDVNVGVHADAEGVDPPPHPTTLSTNDAIVNDDAGEFVIVNDTASVGVPDDDWPSLHPDALYGLAGEIVKAIAPETEADPAGVLLTLLACVGSVVGRGASFAVGPKDHHANEYVAIVGDTASGKGLSWDTVEYLMERVAPEWLNECVVGGLASGEGLIERVRDDDVDADTADGQGFFGFLMPMSKRLLAKETEFSRPIEAMRREGCTLSEVLRSAWDGDVLAVLTRTKSTAKKPIKPLKASNAHVSVVAHVTPEELALLLAKRNGVDAANGFGNRFLWACVRRSKLLPDGGDVSVLKAFVKPLAEAIADARTRGRLRRTPEAAALWVTEYEALTQARPGTWGQIVGRGRAHVVRLALIYALLDGSNVVDVVHLRAALALWAYCEASARRLFGGDTANANVNGDRVVGGGVRDVPLPLHLRLLDAIVKAPGVKRTDLLRSFREASAEALSDALATLERQGLAHRLNVAHGGRPAECWYPGPGDDGPDSPSGGDDAGVFTMGGDAGEFGRKEGSKGDAHADDGGLSSFLPNAGDDGKEVSPADGGLSSFLPSQTPNENAIEGAEGPDLPTLTPHPLSTSDAIAPTVIVIPTPHASPGVTPTAEVPAIDPMATAVGDDDCEAIGEAEFFAAMCEDTAVKPPLQLEPITQEEFEIAMHDLEQYAREPLQTPTHKPRRPEPLPMPQAPKDGAKYAVGRRVRTRLTPEALTVVKATIYGPNAQYYMLSHEDPAWVPPEGVTINENYDRPRLCVELNDIIGETGADLNILKPEIPRPGGSEAPRPAAYDCVAVYGADTYAHLCERYKVTST